MDNLLIHPKDTYCIKKDEFLHGVDKCEVYNKYTGALLTVMSYKEYTDVLGASLNTAGYLNLKIGKEKETDDFKVGDTVALKETNEFYNQMSDIWGQHGFGVYRQTFEIKASLLKAFVNNHGVESLKQFSYKVLAIGEYKSRNEKIALIEATNTLHLLVSLHGLEKVK